MERKCFIYKSWGLALIVLMLTACGPDITSLNPENGPERTLVEIEGDNFLSSVYWDAGTISEQQISSGFLGAYFFTVPPGAALGAHDVQLKRLGNAGNQVPFTVTASVPFGAPRLDRVSIVYAGFSADGQVNTWLYVQGANIDVAAEVLIDGNVAPTVAHKGIQNDLFGVNPQDLNYPIYHYLALLAAPGPQAVGTVLNVRVRNADDMMSNTLQYTLPLDEATLDSDGDDLLDDWERNGYDADGDGVVDVDLPALGAHPLRPDIFVEVDVMAGLTNTPGNAVWSAVREAFANAPVINPVTDNGINLVLDTSGAVPHSQLVSLTGATNAAIDLTNFYDPLRDDNFDNDNRGRIFHYCIWGDMQPGGYSGISDVDINDDLTDYAGPGDDFIVSFDDFGAAYQTVRSMAATFMHELGHNLQQRHGGVDHYQYNPTYSSVMSYSWQLRTGVSNAIRRNRPIYAPFYYQLNSAVEVDGAIPAGVTSVLPDYSQGMGRNLVENNLNEPVGLYNGNGIDWNSDGDTDDVGVSRILNGDGDTVDTLVDYANWANLIFSGPRLNGEYNP